MHSVSSVHNTRTKVLFPWLFRFKNYSLLPFNNRFRDSSRWLYVTLDFVVVCLAQMLTGKPPILKEVTVTFLSVSIWLLNMPLI